MAGAATKNGDLPQRILMTADTVGGVWSYALDLARGLTERGVKIGLATMGAPVRQAQRSEVESIAGLTLYESHFKLEWMDEPWDDVQRAGNWLLELESGFEPDLIHLNGYAHATLPWHAPTMVVGHSCVLSWWDAVKREPAPERWMKYRNIVREGLQAAGLVVAPTAAMLSSLDRYYGPLRNQKVIYNGGDSTLFTPAHKCARIFASGRVWDEAKNLTALDSIAARLPWPVYVAGDGRHPNGNLIQPANCRSLGRLPRQLVAKWLGSASIFVHPARYEPFGLSALEAALCGCALVLGDIPSLRELWEGAATFVPVECEESLEKAILDLTRDTTLRDKLAGQARMRALELTIGRTISEYISAYRLLLD